MASYAILASLWITRAEDDEEGALPAATGRTIGVSAATGYP